MIWTRHKHVPAPRNKLLHLMCYDGTTFVGGLIFYKRFWYFARATSSIKNKTVKLVVDDVYDVSHWSEI